MQDLRITSIQAPLVWEDPAANLHYFAGQLRGLRGETDLIVLPEMFTTGFTMNAGPLAETMDGPSVRWMTERARELNAAITGSLIILDRRRYYNRLVFAYPDGEVVSYDKRYLFTPAGEDAAYHRGRRRTVIPYRGWCIRPLICYDLRFPVWSRQLLDDPYDVLVYVASWPAARAEDWRTLLRARAVENQCYVVGVNRIGKDGNGYVYSGDSCVIDPGPRRELYVADSREEAVTVTLSAKELHALRQRLPFLRDADYFAVDSPR